MKTPRIIILACMAMVLVATMSGCMRARIVNEGIDTPIGLDRHIVVAEEQTDIPSPSPAPTVQPQHQQDNAASNEPESVGSDAETQQPEQLTPQEEPVNPPDQDRRQARTTATRDDGKGNADEASSASADPSTQTHEPDPSSQEHEQTDTPNPNPDPDPSPENTDPTENPGDDEGTSPHGDEIDANTSAGDEGEGEKRDPNSDSDQTVDYSSKLASYKSMIRGKNQSLMCAMMKVYGEYETDYQVINAGTPLGIALKLPELMNIGEIKMDAASDAWVADSNPGIIVKLVPSTVLGPGISDTSAAESVVASLKGRTLWNTTDAVKREGIVLVSGDFAETEVGQRVLSLYLGMTAYPSAYADIREAGGIAAAYRDITGLDLDGMYFYPEEPRAVGTEG